jgi:hypothetical protein
MQACFELLRSPHHEGALCRHALLRKLNEPARNDASDLVSSVAQSKKQSHLRKGLRHCFRPFRDQTLPGLGMG